MPRRAVITRRPLDADPVYDSTLVTQMVNKVLRDGKKSTSEGVVYGALERIRDRTGRDPVAVMEEAVRNVTPALEVKSRRVGGATYQVPIEVPARRGRTLAIRWIVRFARERREKQMSERLSVRRVAPSSARTTSTAWHRPTRPSRTTAGRADPRPPGRGRSSVEVSFRVRPSGPPQGYGRGGRQ
jgi:small subunit ribosomal protein S7